MRIIVNGFLTDPIPLERGVRQGDSLSPLLYILCAEVLATNIRSDPTIQGFLLPDASGRRFKISQYADNSTCFVKDPFSLNHLFILINKFEVGTGAKLNVSKSEAMWLGAWRSCSDTPFGLQWVPKLKILGVWFSNGTTCVDPENWLPRLTKLENNLNLWKTRSLSLVGKVLVINLLGASKFWYLSTILPLPVWVAHRFQKLVFPFLWGSKIETISCNTLYTPVDQGGLGLIDVITKSKALKIASIVGTISKPLSKCFFLFKYFVGSQVARLQAAWSFLRDNLTPSALQPSLFYSTFMDSIQSLVKRVHPVNSFTFSSKACYQEILKETVSPAVLSHSWSPVVGRGFCLSHHWAKIRDSRTENFKHDVAWFITHRGIKVRDSLHTWGYINSASCATCTLRETIEHCFVTCQRVWRVWSHFGPTLSALLHQPFTVTPQTIFFYMWPSLPTKEDTITRYLIKSILYGLWTFCNKATFHNGTESPRAIVRYIWNDITTRLHVDFFRLSLPTFEKLWCHPSICAVNQRRLIIHLPP